MSDVQSSTGSPVSRNQTQGASDDRADDKSGIIAFMARNGVSANLLILFIIVAGLISFGRIGQEVFPESTLDTIAVTITYPGATPEEIEESIVQRVEEAIKSIEGAKKISSTASEGVGSTNVQLEIGTDSARALDEIKFEIDQITSFPEDAEEPTIRELTTRQVVLRIALFGDVSERVLKESALVLEDDLAQLDDVSYVETSGVRDYQIFANISQDQLRSLDLSITDVSNIVAANSLDSPAGSVDTGAEEVRVRTVGRNYSQQDFEDIVLVSSEDGALLRLGDVADIQDGFEDADLITRFNDKPVAFVDVYRTSDDRVIDVAEAVKNHLAVNLRFPPGVEHSIWQDDSKLLNDRLSLLLKNAALGLLLVLVSLTLFLDIRLAFWTAVGIGATFTGAFFILDYAGSSINMFSLFGFILALGLVVDDAVVVGESIYQERERGRSGLGAAIAGTHRVKMPVIFAVLTTITAFLPLLAVTGVIGKVLADIPLVVLAVLSISLIESLLVLPNHLAHLSTVSGVARNRISGFLARIQSSVDDAFKLFIEGPLQAALRFTVRAPFIVLSAGLFLLIVSVATVPAGIIKFSFFPDIEADIVTATVEMPAGTPISQTAAVVKRIEDAGDRAVAGMSDQGNNTPSFVKATYSTIGLRSTGSGPRGPTNQFSPNLADVRISLVPAKDRSVSAVAIEQAWRDELGDVAEAETLTISSSLLSLGDPVNVQISHPDEVVLDQVRSRVMDRLETLSGVFDVVSDDDAGIREVGLRLKPSARTLGVTLQDVAAQVRAGFFGMEAVRVQRGREDVRVYIRLPEDERDSIADIERFRIRLPGGFASLGAIADVSFREAPTEIRREDGKRVITITANAEGSVITGQEATRFLEEEVFPPMAADYPQLGYAFGGEEEQRQESFSDLGAAFLLSLVAIYALLAIPFKSYTQPLVIMAAIPFGLVGALVGHMLLGIPLGILSIFGIVALSGVIINGSLVLLNFLNENLAAGMAPDDAMIDAAKSRFRPIMLTAITTFLGVAPITFETSIGAQFLIPMSASLGFGVLIGTGLLMFMIPALGVIHLKARIAVASKFGRKSAASN